MGSGDVDHSMYENTLHHLQPLVLNLSTLTRKAGLEVASEGVARLHTHIHTILAENLNRSPSSACFSSFEAVP